MNLRVICSQCGDLLETNSRRQAERIMLLHGCDGYVDIEELYEEPPRQIDWDLWALGGVIFILVFALISFLCTVFIGARIPT